MAISSQSEDGVSRPQPFDVGQPIESGLKVKRYLYEHRVHIGAVLAFFLYPFIYNALTGLPAIGDTIGNFLPATRFMIVVIYLGLFAISFDFISGYTGYLSFGHAAFFGVGAYFVILATHPDKFALLPQDTPFMITMVIGATLALIAAILIGLVSFRLTGVYFAMITLGFAQIMYELVRNWDWIGSNPTDGPGTQISEAYSIGVPYVDQLSIDLGVIWGSSFENVFGLGFDIGPRVMSYLAIGAVALIAYLMMQRIIHSPFGRVMIAIRENEERARAVGYNVYWFKLWAFAISGFFGGIAGALAAGYYRAMSPEETFFFLVTAEALITAIIGGLGTLAGPLYGMTFFQWLEDLLSTAADGGFVTFLRDVVPDSIYTADLLGLSMQAFVDNALDGRSQLYLGIVFVLFVLFVPNGILGTVRSQIGGKAAEHLPDHLSRYLSGLRDR